MFGILNDIMARRASRALSAVSPPPSRVLFVYVASQKNELALLQRRLVADARCAGVRVAWGSEVSASRCLQA